MSTLSLKDLNKIPVRLASGHRLCAGCAEAIIARQILMGTEKDVVVTCSTGCFEVSTTIFPYTSWKVPYVHTAFGNGAATCAGVESAYESLKRQGKIDKDIRFVNFAGDDNIRIGLQALSGRWREDTNLFVCLTTRLMNTVSRDPPQPEWEHPPPSWREASHRKEGVRQGHDKIIAMTSRTSRRSARMET